MLAVFLLFLVPVGGGIPAGVLLAKSRGLPWALTAGLYLVSDLVLAVAFEPVLKLLAAFAGRVPALARFGAVLRETMARNAERYGTGAGPLTLVLIAFGVDPMTGRASALAAGHGFLAGWAFAIAGDMLYYAVVALVTLRLATFVKNPETTVALVLVAMILLPALVQRFRQPAP